MLDKLEAIKLRYDDIQNQLGDPGVTSDMDRFYKLNKEYKDLGPIMKAYESYRKLMSNIQYNRDILKNDSDAELRDMAKNDLWDLEEEQKKMEEEIKWLLVPKDPQDEKNAILEIRAGTGGDEASIFTGDLFRMYSRFLDLKGWKVEVISANENPAGGYKEIVCEVSGENVYGTLKYESGVHRVQRIPKTESCGRIHTSASTVAVLPEADEVDVKINPADLKIDTFRSSGAGGQNVNKVETGVRISHLPSGMVSESTQARTQGQNREIAMNLLRTRMYELELEKHHAEISAQRKSLVSTGDRSAKIRTYNYPQGRVTDHRINLTLYNLDMIMNGYIQEIIDSLMVAENAEKLKDGS